MVSNDLEHIKLFSEIIRIFIVVSGRMPFLAQVNFETQCFDV